MCHGMVGGGGGNIFAPVGIVFWGGGGANMYQLKLQCVNVQLNEKTNDLLKLGLCFCRARTAVV